VTRSSGSEGVLWHAVVGDPSRQLAERAGARFKVPERPLDAGEVVAMRRAAVGVAVSQLAKLIRVEERRPELRVLLADSIRGWMEQLEEARGGESEDDFALGPDQDEERSEALFRLAVEHAWLLDGDADEDEGDGLALVPEPELEESGAPLALLATDPDVSPEISIAAGECLSTVQRTR
jgi:hypothetical protein